MNDDADQSTLAFATLRVCGPPTFVNYSYAAIDPASGEAVLFDPAWDLAKIEAAVERHGGRPSAICLTHSHPDHVHLVAELVRRHRCPVYASQAECDFYGYRCQNLEAFAQDGDLGISTVPVRAIFTPGHTCGSTCYVIHDRIITGDTLFSEGCGMCTGRGASAAQMFESLALLKREISPETLVFPGHSFGVPPGRRFGALRDTNLYLQFETLDSFVAFRMRPHQRGLFDFR